MMLSHMIPEPTIGVGLEVDRATAYPVTAQTALKSLIVTKVWAHLTGHRV